MRVLVCDNCGWLGVPRKTMPANHACPICKSPSTREEDRAEEDVVTTTPAGLRVRWSNNRWIPA